jgi:hypothetical protein
MADLLLLVSLGLGGCSRLIDNYNSDYGKLLSAAPVTGELATASNMGLVPVNWTLTQSRNMEKMEANAYIAGVAFDSIVKCDYFTKSQGLIARGVSTDLDLATTVLTALATVFTPIATIHALTGTALITSGWKDNLNSNLYAKYAAEIIGNQIDTSYFTPMYLYVQDLQRRAERGDKLNPQFEVIRIVMIHRECDVGRALGALAVKAKQPNAPSAEDAGSGITAEKLVGGKMLPRTLPGGPYTIVSVTPPFMTIRRTSGGPLEIKKIDELLAQINAKPAPL